MNCSKRLKDPPPQRTVASDVVKVASPVSVDHARRIYLRRVVGQYEPDVAREVDRVADDGVRVPDHRISDRRQSGTAHCGTEIEIGRFVLLHRSNGVERYYHARPCVCTYVRPSVAKCAGNKRLGLEAPIVADVCTSTKWVRMQIFNEIVDFLDIFKGKDSNRILLEVHT